MCIILINILCFNKCLQLIKTSGPIILNSDEDFMGLHSYQLDGDLPDLTQNITDSPYMSEAEEEYIEENDEYEAVNSPSSSTPTYRSFLLTNNNKLNSPSYTPSSPPASNIDSSKPPVHIPLSPPGCSKVGANFITSDPVPGEGAQHTLVPPNSPNGNNEVSEYTAKPTVPLPHN